LIVQVKTVVVMEDGPKLPWSIFNRMELLFQQIMELVNTKKK